VMVSFSPTVMVLSAILVTLIFSLTGDAAGAGVAVMASVLARAASVSAARSLVVGPVWFMVILISWLRWRCLPRW